MISKVDFKHYSSIKVGPKVDVLEVVEIDRYDSYKIVGRANNLLISNSPPPLLLLSKKFDYIKRDGQYLFVGARTLSGRLFSFTKRENIGGFEILSNLPGSIGGVVKMNAGLKEWEICAQVYAIKTEDGYKKEIDFGYRSSDIRELVYEVVFKIDKKFDPNLVELFRGFRKNQPKEPSAGSCFKNPKGDFAGRVIERVGLKGFRIGDMAFSDIHSNFLINLGDGEFDDALTLIKLAKKRAFEDLGITLELEIEIL